MLRRSGILVVLACFGAFLAVGTSNAAETERGFFDVTVRGQIAKRWTYVENNPDTECRVRRTFRGREAFTFRSRRPTRVLVRSRADSSLVLGALLRNISGTYLQTGIRADRSLAAACPNPVSYSTRCTPPRMTADRGGTVSVSAPRKGLIRLSKLRLAIRLPRALSACEPRGVATLATRAEVASARAVARDVFDPKARTTEFDAGRQRDDDVLGRRHRPRHRRRQLDDLVRSRRRVANWLQHEALCRRAALDTAMRRPQSRPYRPGYERSRRPCLAPPSAPRRRGPILKPVRTTFGV